MPIKRSEVALEDEAGDLYPIEIMLGGSLRIGTYDRTFDRIELTRQDARELGELLTSYADTGTLDQPALDKPSAPTYHGRPYDVDWLVATLSWLSTPAATPNAVNRRRISRVLETLGVGLDASELQTIRAYFPDQEAE